MKTYISDSLISEALILIQTMKQNDCFDLSKVESINTYYGINKAAAINLAMQCHWLRICDGVSYEITPFGTSLLERFDGMILRFGVYRDILKNYILICKPIWARRIPYGRNEAFRIMSDEEQVCFRKAGLMNTPVTKDVVDWWDALAEIERREIEQLQEDVGRKGEELTIRYEKERTRVNPVWESIDSNLAGYDILSQVDATDTHQILIEVKSTTRNLRDAFFFVSLNEWRFASAGYNQKRYYFYLWLLGREQQLAIVSYSDMVRHIPQDNGQGEWNEVSIPFSAFEASFRPVRFIH